MSDLAKWALLAAAAVVAIGLIMSLGITDAMNGAVFSAGIANIVSVAADGLKFGRGLVNNFVLPEATLTMMERLCSDKDHPELYVPTFKNNYSQMKIDGPKSHGKVFEDDGERVWIWSEVETVLLQYKNSFYQGEE